MTVDVSWFSIISILALAVFMGVMIPRAMIHVAALGAGAASGRKTEPDRWLIAIAAAFLICASLGGVTAFFNANAQALLDRSEAVALSFLLFAAPAVLQVLRAWSNAHRHKAGVQSHALVALAILSLPASMAIPTATLMQSRAPETAQVVAAAAPAAPGVVLAVQAPAMARQLADNPAAAVASDRFFTDNEVANDPTDYPVAAWLARCCTVAVQVPTDRVGEAFVRHVPTFTAYWIDQTTQALSLDATDAFGVMISRITHVRSKWAMDAAVLLYKLLCALVVVAVSYDNLIRPLAERTRAKRS